MAVAEPSTRTRLSSAGLSAAIVALVGYALITGLNVPFPHVVDSTLKVFGVAPPSPRPPTPEKVTVQPKLSPKAEGKAAPPNITSRATPVRSEEHTSELQSLMRISYAVFFLKKKNKYQIQQNR